MKLNSMAEFQEQAQYCEITDTYLFKGDIKLTFDLDVDANVRAKNIIAGNITAYDITSRNITDLNIVARKIDAQDLRAKDVNAVSIDAYNIYAKEIRYSTFCLAFSIFHCDDIKGYYRNAKHFSLDVDFRAKRKR